MYLINQDEHFSKIDKNSFFITDKVWGKVQFNSGIDEFNLIKWCQDNFVNSNKNFVDIGAHIGSWTWTLAHTAKHTYSFEAHPHFYNCLSANICLKELSNKISTYNIGLSSCNAEKTYYQRIKHWSGSSGFEYLGPQDDDLNKTIKYQFNLKKLDDFKLENIGFLKIDVEGHEKEVLIGAYETLKNNNWPTFIIESWAEFRETNSNEPIPAIKIRKELFEYINSINYEIIPIRDYDEMFLCKFKKGN